MTTPTHRYLEGNFGPVHEEITAVDLPVTGTIPAELDGRLLRNGPNPIGAAGPRDLPLVHRRRHGARPAHPRRQGRVVPQPLGAQPRGRGRARRARRRRRRTATTSRSSPPTRTSIGHRGQDVRDRRSRRAAGRAHRRARDRRPVQLRRARSSTRSARTPSATRCTGELHVVAYYWAWGNKIRYMSISPDGRVQKSVDVDDARWPDGARHGVHREVRVAVRPAGHVRPRGRDGRPAAAVLLEQRVRRAHRAAAARARRPTGPTCGGSTSSRATSSTRSTRTTSTTGGSCSTRCGTRRCSTRTARARTRARRASTAGRSTRPRARCSRRRSTTAPRSSRGSTRRCRVSATGTGTASAFGVDDDRARPGAQARPRRRHDRWSTTTGTGRHDARAGVRAPRGRDGGGRRLGDVLRLRRDRRDTADVVILDAQDFTGDPVATIHLPVRVPYGFHGNWVPTT